MDDLNNQVLDDLHAQIISQRIDLNKLKRNQRITNLTLLGTLLIMSGCFFFMYSINDKILNTLISMIENTERETKQMEGRLLLPRKQSSPNVQK